MKNQRNSNHDLVICTILFMVFFVTGSVLTYLSMNPKPTQAQNPDLQSNIDNCVGLAGELKLNPTQFDYDVKGQVCRLSPTDFSDYQFKASELSGIIRGLSLKASIARNKAMVPCLTACQTAYENSNETWETAVNKRHQCARACQSKIPNLPKL